MGHSHPIIRRAAIYAIFAAAVAASCVVLGSANRATAAGYLGVSCVRMIAGPSGEVLVNGCGVCRRVGVERTRPGAQFPAARTAVVPPNGRIELDFLGPGRTRLVSEEACRGSAESATPAADGRQCVQFGRSKGAFVLVNGCSQCRSVVVERMDAAGRRDQATYLIGAKSVLPYSPAGAAKAAIAADTACR